MLLELEPEPELAEADLEHFQYEYVIVQDELDAKKALLEAVEIEFEIVEVEPDVEDPIGKVYLGTSQLH